MTASSSPPAGRKFRIAEGAAQDRRTACHSGRTRSRRCRNLFASPAFRRTNTGGKIWPMSGSCRWSGRKDGHRPIASAGASAPGAALHPADQGTAWRKGSQQLANRSIRSRSARLDRLLARIGDARIVLLGEATHGTSEFYRMRDRITRELISKKGFRFVAIEGDWPDAARIDHYVRHLEYPAVRVDRVRALSRPGCGATTRCARSSTGCATHNAAVKPADARRLPWSRSLQPLRLDPRGAEISRRGRPGDGAGRTRAVRLPDARGSPIPPPTAMRRSPAAIRPAKPRSRSFSPSFCTSGVPMRNGTASGSWMPCRTHG